LKSLSMISVILVIALTLGACSSNNNQGEGTSTTSTSQTASDGSEERVADGKMKDEVVIAIPRSVDPNAKIDANLPQGDSIENNQFTRYIKEKVNVSFKSAWTTAPASFEQKLQLAIAANELPDMFVVGENDFIKLAENEQLADLTDAYNKYASPILKKVYESTNGMALKQATVNGKLVAMPNINTMADFTNLVWVRKDWLDKVGLPLPKSLDDLKTIAKAFVEQDPDGNGKADTVGFPGPDKTQMVVNNEKNHYFGFEPILALDKAFPGMWVKDDKGEIVYGSVQDNIKNGLQTLQQMYADGLIDKQFPFRDDPSILVKNGQAGIFFGPWWMPLGMLQDSVRLDPKAEWIPIIAPLGEDGSYLTNRGSTSGDYVVVNKGFAQPEALILYLNIYVANLIGEDKEGELKLDPKIDLGYWPIRTTIEWGDKVSRTYAEVQKAIDGEVTVDNLTADRKQVYEALQRDKLAPRKVAADWGMASAWLESGKVLSTGMTEVYNEFTGTTQTMKSKWATLEKLEEETYLKIVTGKEPIESFDKFVEKWKKLGGDQITKEVREIALD
jgi:putative aldouronate transport system substrate-binding protein